MEQSRPSPTRPISSSVSGSEHGQADKPVSSTVGEWDAALQAVGERQDTAAFHALYQHFAPKIKAFYGSHGLSSHAEELTHEVFLKVWQKAHTYKPEKGAASAWLFTLVRNQRIELYRKDRLGLLNKPASQSQQDELETIAAEDERSDERLDHRRIAALFEYLTVEQRNVLQKVYFEDKSHQHAAQELGMTVGMVKSRIRSALKVLRTHLSGEAK